LEVPAIIARLSRETLDPATREQLQGVTVGICESMLRRRPERAFEPRERELYNNLTKAAFDGLANLNNPDEVIYYNWQDKNRDTPLGKLVSELDETQWNDSWQRLTVEQGSKIRKEQAAKQKAVEQRAKEAKIAEDKRLAKEREQAEQLKAESEKKARQDIVAGLKNPRVDRIISRIGFGVNDVDFQQAMTDLDHLKEESSTPISVIDFAKDVLTRYRALSSSGEGLVTRTTETVIERPGIAGLGRKTRQAIRYGLDDRKYEKLVEEARTVDNGQFNLSQRAILEALNLIHTRIYPPS
jgi:hypothetical protein